MRLKMWDRELRYAHASEEPMVTATKLVIQSGNPIKSVEVERSPGRKEKVLINTGELL
jgi:hypothetical protein